MSDESPGFRVTDRRASSKESAADSAPSKSAGDAGDHAGSTGDLAGGEQSAGPMEFGTFAVSLATSALMHLNDRGGDGGGGDGSGATGEQMAANLQLAQQTIDILEMLEKKTEGNLSDDEKRLLSKVLYDLRMRYVAARGR